MFAFYLLVIALALETFSTFFQFNFTELENYYCCLLLSFIKKVKKKVINI